MRGRQYLAHLNLSGNLGLADPSSNRFALQHTRVYKTGMNMTAGLKSNKLNYLIRIYRLGAKKSLWSLSDKHKVSPLTMLKIGASGL